MLDAFSTALGTSLTAFVTDLSDAIGTNLTVVIPVALGLVGIFLLWGVVKGFIGSR